LELARSWLNQCQQEHQRCNPHPSSTVSSILPTRVLDLGDPTRPFDFSNVKLFESHNETSDYACLSHCWGKLTLRTTTRATLQSNRANIPWSSLPKTFQDAIKVTHKLGIRYLWIDSLCIIQDDPKDWGRESALMAEIYGSSTITLAATASKNANDGLFFDLPNEFAHQKMQVANTKCIPGNVYYRLNLPHCEQWEISDVHRADYPLLTRAWVYQEQFLSRRILHFTKTELTWECSEISTCQCIVDREWPPKPHPSLPSKYFRGFFTPGKPPYATVRFPKERYADMAWNPSNYDLSEKWYDILRQYCRLDLTFEKDKLPALSGIAKVMQYLRKNEIYLAGLWKDSLHRDLCWYFEDPGQRRPGDRAPSWSWVSVNGKKLKPLGPVYTFGNDQQKISVLDADCTLAGTDTTGQVFSGYLKCRGWLLRGKLEKDSASRPRFAVPGWYSSFHHDFPLFNEGSIFEKNKEIFLVRILDAGTDMSSLVLRRVDAKSNTYERIGFLKSTNQNWQRAKWLQTTLSIV
jgi:hypothetical protein